MLIIFGGWGGLLVLPFALIAVVAGGLVGQELGLKGGPILLPVAGIFAFLCIFFGILLRDVGRYRHSLFFLSLEWWGVIVGVGTVALVVFTNEHPSSSAQATPDTVTTSPTSRVAATMEPAAPVCISHSDSSKVRVFCWTKTVEKDPITDEAHEKVVSEVVFPDGTDVEAEIKFDGLAVDFYMRTFQKDKPISFAFGDQKTLAMRLRIDGGELRSAIAPEQLTNEVFVFFYDLAAVRSAVGIDDNTRTVSGNNGYKMLGDFFRMTMTMSAAELTKMAGGQLSELLTAQHILVELPLSNNSFNIVDLNPNDPLVRQFALKSLASIRDRLGATIAPSKKTAVQSAETPDTGSSQQTVPHAPRVPPKKRTRQVCTTLNGISVCE